MMSASDHSTKDCNGCPLVPNRRTFLRRAAETLGGTLLTLGFATETVQALSLASAVAVSPREGGSSTDPLTYPVPTADGVQIDKEHQVILVRSLGSVYAFALSCPHQNTALRWNEKEDHFICPKHHSEYASDGYFVTGRATRGMDRYVVKRQGNDIVVDLTALKKQSDEPDAWKAAFVKL